MHCRPAHLKCTRTGQANGERREEKEAGGIPTKHDNGRLVRESAAAAGGPHTLGGLSTTETFSSQLCRPRRSRRWRTRCLARAPFLVRRQQTVSSCRPLAWPERARRGLSRKPLVPFTRAPPPRPDPKAPPPSTAHWGLASTSRYNLCQEGAAT